MTKLVDFHMHLVSHGEVECTHELVLGFLETLKRRNIAYAGFTDHDRFLHLLDHAAIESAVKMVPEVNVSMGAEVDFFPERKLRIIDYVNSLDVDYVMGSVHNIGDWAFDNPNNIGGYDAWDIDDLYRAYYDRIRSAADTGVFNIIGHIDIIKVLGFRPASDSVSHAESTLETIRKRGCAVEINTNGKYKPVGEFYPEFGIIKRCFEMNIPITLGSDAHAPENAGRDLDMAADLARKAGYTKVAFFKDKEIGYLSI